MWCGGREFEDSSQMAAYGVVLAEVAAACGLATEAMAIRVKRELLNFYVYCVGSRSLNASGIIGECSDPIVVRNQLVEFEV
ncbi:hypothetical protein AAHA92_01715 [Salvia divinorum]|uniref:Uncharacterized protein n=1 Tax=Salvia divinorum TaxID=28513 RepID=A0ABD1IBG2_SALDI